MNLLLCLTESNQQKQNRERHEERRFGRISMRRLQTEHVPGGGR